LGDGCIIAARGTATTRAFRRLFGISDGRANGFSLSRFGLIAAWLTIRIRIALTTGAVVIGIAIALPIRLPTRLATRLAITRRFTRRITIAVAASAPIRLAAIITDDIIAGGVITGSIITGSVITGGDTARVAIAATFIPVTIPAVAVVAIAVVTIAVVAATIRREVINPVIGHVIASAVKFLIAVIVKLVATTARLIFLKARAGFGEDTKIMIGKLQIIFGVNPVTLHLRVARQGFKFF